MRYFAHWYSEARKPTMEIETIGIKGVKYEPLPIFDSILFAWMHRKSKPTK